MSASFHNSVPVRHRKGPPSQMPRFRW